MKTLDLNLRKLRILFRTRRTLPSSMKIRFVIKLEITCAYFSVLFTTVKMVILSPIMKV